MRYVSYSPDVEKIGSDEVELFEGIAKTFQGQGETVAKKEGRATRVSHAKSTALLKGELIVNDGLPAELAQGLFQGARRYEVLARLAQGPGELLDDKVSTHRGFSLKILGVVGAQIPEAQDPGVQDFLLEDGKAFINSDAKRFALNLKAGVSKAPLLPEGVKSVVSDVAHVANSAIKAVGGQSKTLDFFGHDPLHPLAEKYFSQVPYRYGAYIAKIGLFPSAGLEAQVGGVMIDHTDDPNRFRNAVRDHFSSYGAEFDLRMQLCTDLEKMPVEDAATEWPEEMSPYRTVARIRFDPQASHTAARAAFVDEHLSFKPANALIEHQPLGQVMRARLFVYQKLADLRRQANHVEPVSPRSLADIPD